MSNPTLPRRYAAVAMALAATTLWACAGNQTPARAPAADAEPASRAALKAALFFKNPVLSFPELSPDGSRIAAVLAQGGSEVLIVRPTGGGEVQPITKLERTHNRPSYRIQRVVWPSNERLLVSVERPSQTPVGVPARKTRLMSVPLDGSPIRYLGEDWPYEEHSQVRNRIISPLPDDPDHVLMSLWMPTQNGHGVTRLSVDTGRYQTTVRARYGSLWWAADHRHVVRAGGGEPESGTERFVYARPSGDHAFDEILRWDPFADGAHGFSFAAFSEDPYQLYVWKSSESNRRALYRYDLQARRLGPQVFGHPEYDLGGVETSPEDGRLLRIHYDAEKPEVHYVDAQADALGRELDRAVANQLRRTISSDALDRFSILATSSDVKPPRYYLFDRGAQALSPLFSAYPQLEKLVLSPMEPVRYEARDGLLIHGYVTRPLGAPGPHPTIVYPHGGPSARDVWGWDPVVQYLASLGFAVFQPNFRGSDGYGRAFEELGSGQWGLSMQDDITDGTRWLIAEGIADPARIGIYGAGYGGYAALWGLATAPLLYRAGASFAGVTDLTLLRSDDARDEGGVGEMETLLGDRWDDRERLIASSPARNAHKIRAPVLIAHGTEDPHVHVTQAEAMAEALEGAGGSAELHLYRGEVHDLLDERNRIDFYSRLGEFFQRHLHVGADPLGSAGPPMAAGPPMSAISAEARQAK